MFPTSELKILLIAEESAGVQVFKALAGSGHRIVAVLSSESGGGNASLAALVQRQGYPTLPAGEVKDPAFADWIRSAGVDIVINAHSLYIVHPRILEAARIGTFNLHPGPLPQYAGLNTVSWAIYNGETSYGVTLHWMAPDIDAGDIAFQTMFFLDETDTPFRLMHKCVAAEVPLALALLETAAADPGAIPRLPQDPAKRRYFGRKAPMDGLLNWSRPAAEIVNLVRACNYSPFPSPWGHPSAILAGREFRLIKAARTHRACAETPGTVGLSGESGVLVAASDEWVLVQRLTSEDRAVAPLEFLAGTANSAPSGGASA